MSSQLLWLASSSECVSASLPSTRTSIPQMAAQPARKRRGHGDRPNILDTRCGTTHSTNQPPRAAIRTPARQMDEGGSATAVEGDAVQLHAMVDQAEAELLGDPL